MATESARLALPFIEAGQAQKEWTHNEAIALLDVACQATVAGIRAAPPEAPVAGECWIVGTSPSGAWAGHAGAIAGWTAGGWRFVSPREGLAAWALAEATVIRHRGGEWRLDRVAPIPAPAGGTVVDVECRAAVGAILPALSARGWLA